MSADVVVQATLKTAEDVAAAVQKWQSIADEYERAKFDAFIAGIAQGAMDRARELEVDLGELTPSETEKEKSNG